MLPRKIVEEIDRLVREGELSQRKIAVRVGVSRATVSDIASGRRKLYGREPEYDSRRRAQSASPPARCPHCGYRVYMPCLICRARKRQRLQQLLATIMPRGRAASAASYRSHEPFVLAEKSCRLSPEFS